MTALMGRAGPASWEPSSRFGELAALLDVTDRVCMTATDMSSTTANDGGDTSHGGGASDAGDSGRRTAEARAAVAASLASVGSSMDGEMRVRAADLHANADAIAKQEKDVGRQTAVLAKQCAQWQKLTDSTTHKLNEMGDMQKLGRNYGARPARARGDGAARRRAARRARRSQWRGRG